MIRPLETARRFNYRLPLSATALLLLLSFGSKTTASAADEDYRYKFPCEPGATCFVTTGLHGSSGFAIDFDIGGGATDGTVLAMAEGVVDFFADDFECTYPDHETSRGRYAVITDVLRASSYAHLASTISNPSFPTALQGDPIGIEGDTGYTYRRDDQGNIIPCGVHLHWDPAAAVSIEGRSTASLCAICSYSSTNSWIGDPTEAFFPETAIRNAFRANGGWAQVGWTVDAGNRGDNALYPHPWPLSAPCGTEQNFKKDEGTTAGISGIYASTANPSAAYWVQPDFAAVWWALPVPCSLGYPTSNKGPCPTGSPQGCVALQQFEGGFIWTDGVSIRVYSADLFLAGYGSSSDYLRLTPGLGWQPKDGLSPGNPTDLRYFGSGLLFHRDGDLLRRSADTGGSWLTITPPAAGLKLRNYDKGPDGVLWVLWKDDAPNPDVIKLYSSSDDGDTWSAQPVFTAAVGPSNRYKVSVHPSKPGYLAVAYDSNVNFRPTVSVSTNGGASWSTHQVSTDNGGAATNGDAQHQVLWTEQDRIVYWYMRANSPVLLRIFTSDDLGNQWVERFSKSGATYPEALIRAGPDGPFFGVTSGSSTRATDLFLRSADGSSWEVLQSPVDDVDPAAGMDYETDGDRLWVVFDTTPSSPPIRIYAVESASTRPEQDWLAGFVNLNSVPSSFFSLVYSRRVLVLLHDR